jgi:hypothetical protein
LNFERRTGSCKPPLRSTISETLQEIMVDEPTSPRLDHQRRLAQVALLAAHSLGFEPSPSRQDTGNRDWRHCAGPRRRWAGAGWADSDKLHRLAAPAAGPDTTPVSGPAPVWPADAWISPQHHRPYCRTLYVAAAQAGSGRDRNTPGPRSSHDGCCRPTGAGRALRCGLELRRKAIHGLWAQDGIHVLQRPQEIRKIAAGLAFTSPVLEAHGHDALEVRVSRAYQDFVAPGEFTFRPQDNDDRRRCRSVRIQHRYPDGTAPCRIAAWTQPRSAGIIQQAPRRLGPACSPTGQPAGG